MPREERRPTDDSDEPEVRGLTKALADELDVDAEEIERRAAEIDIEPPDEATVVTSEPAGSPPDES